MAEPAILFTAFEPSGDRLAAPVIAALRAERPGVPVYGFGGPHMAAAGANLLQSTTDKAVMLGGAVSQVWNHCRRVRHLRGWLKEHPLGVFVPVDSPAANWAICKAVRDLQPVAGIVHLAAPQLWAWAPWRIRKLRRLTDHVLCLLPFEPAWFDSRGVKATFVGHPIFSEQDAKSSATSDLPAARLKLALLPGSRHGEIKANWPTMLAAFRQLQATHHELHGVVAAVDEPTADWIRAAAWDGAAGVTIVCGQTDAVLRWADAALVVSGTATLQTAAVGTPFVTLFNVSRLKWHAVGRWLLRTRTFTLVNLIAEWRGLGRAVPEFVPHFGQVEPITAAVNNLLNDPAAHAAQRERLSRVVEPYTGLNFAAGAAQHILAAGGWR